MELELLRDDLTNPVYIPGGIYASDGGQVCKTLERPWNDGDNHSFLSAILPGRFELKPYFSPHLKRTVLQLQNVPGRTAIEIHNANEASQLEGCIAVGTAYANGRLTFSDVALDGLLALVRSYINIGEQVWLTVNNPEEGTS